MMKMGEAAYNTEGEQADSSSATSDRSDETVVDAEFEEVDADDEKKSNHNPLHRRLIRRRFFPLSMMWRV